MGFQLNDQFMVVTFMNGAAMMCCLVAAIFFLKFWKSSADRFFGLFSLAFVILAVERTAIMLSNGMQEADPSVYLLRCIGFSMIIFAVVDKNRKRAE